MAGDWIKMSAGLRRHPKVVRMASALKADRLRVVGALHAVWCVFDEHSSDGTLEGYSLQVMDEEIGWRGFSAAMQAIGWLEVTDTGLEVPRYDEHNGATAKRRAQDADRKASSRAQDGGTKSDRIADWKQTKDGHVSASEADKKKTREEKRREEKEIQPPDGVAASVWSDFLKLRKAKRAPLTDTALHGIQIEAEKAGLSLGDALAICCKRGWQGFEAAWVSGTPQPGKQAAGDWTAGAT